jgi:tetratricopeptide (TPR) repeat protein
MMLLKLIAAMTLLLSAAAGQRMLPDTKSYSTPREAAESEDYLKSHPEDSVVARRLLDYYVARWQTAEADRLRVILWTIENHPNIDLDQSYDARGLLLNPGDREGYHAARQLWLEQVRRHPDDLRILENAAICLRLTDRASAANWLKKAMALNPARREKLTVALADVYAAAISGVSGMNPWEAPTSLDLVETGSEFARRARVEALADGAIAARTGWALYLITEAIHRLGISDADYDVLAEELLLKSAAFDYPKPARLPFLGVFYQRQEGKRAGQVLPKSRMLTVASGEQAERLLSKTTSVGVTGEKTVKGSVHVVLDVVVGTDGHVWKAVSRNAPTELIGSAASGAVQSWVYQPLEIDGESVRVATTVEVTVDVRP